MQFDPVLLAPRMGPMKAQGLWRDETIDVYFQKALQRFPDNSRIVDYCTGQDQPVRLSYGELDRQVDRIARALASLGVGRADVVTFQLPNCWQFIALALACARIGAAANPVMPIFRERELEFMLDFGESKVFVYRRFSGVSITRRWRGVCCRSFRTCNIWSSWTAPARTASRASSYATTLHPFMGPASGPTTCCCSCIVRHHWRAQGSDAYVEHPVLQSSRLYRRHGAG